jgi:uncharacterized metal-binding protein YceD (DUF177 family)
MARPWSAVVAVDEVPETGRRLDLTADAETRAAIARVAGVREVARLQANFDLARHGRDSLRVVGSVSATVEQTCVVTLDPVRNEVVEAIDLLFAPQLEAAAGDAHAGAQTVDADDPPEVLAGGAVDLGAVATEFLLLGIDPYPRRPDAVFDAPRAGGPTANPFAALARLKPGRGEADG